MNLLRAALLSSLFSILSFGQTSRSFYMSVSGIQAVPNTQPVYQNFPANYPPQAVGQDTDMVTVFPEYLGIPFELFTSSTTPPASHPWTIQMNALAAKAKAVGKPILLQTVLIRDVPVAKATGTATVTLDAGWAPRCMDFTNPAYASLATSYPNYVYWLAKIFSPRYFVVMIEANLYYVNCGGNTASWRKLVEIYRASYTRAKTANLSSVVFPSFKLEDIYRQSLTGFDQAQMTALAPMTRDRLGLATYAYGVRPDGVRFANPYELPADYLTRIRDRNPAEPKIVVTETGWNSEPIALTAAGSCVRNYLYSSPAFEAAYMNFLMQSAYVGAFDGVVWWSGRDLILGTAMSTCYMQVTAPEFAECNGDIWCRAVSAERSYPRPNTTPEHAELVFKAFGAMGLSTYEGVGKSGVADVWRKFLAIPRL